MIQSANQSGKNAAGLRYGAPCELLIEGRNDGGTVFPVAPPDRQGVSDAARKVFWVRRREFGGMDRTNARMLNSLSSPCQGVPVWRKLEATRGGRIETLNAGRCARGGERWLPAFILETIRFVNQHCGERGTCAGLE